MATAERVAQFLRAAMEVELRAVVELPATLAAKRVTTTALLSHTAIQVRGIQNNGRDSSMGTCTALPIGAGNIDAGFTPRNSVVCRISAASLAKNNPATYCSHGGPAGFLNCGPNCDAFCTIAQSICPSAFNSMSECLVICSGLTGFDQPYNITNNLNTFQCRMFHLTLAAVSTTNAAKHCPYVGVPTTTCP